jgi:hypothetical protein
MTDGRHSSALVTVTNRARGRRAPSSQPSGNFACFMVFSAVAGRSAFRAFGPRSSAVSRTPIPAEHTMMDAEFGDRDLDTIRESRVGTPRSPRPRACSGLMYAAVPIVFPGSVSPGALMVRVWSSALVAVAAVTDFASPKSRILTRPSGVTRMLAGFRSRCTMPAACAAAMPSAI